MKIFFDTEFTGLHKNTTLISIGMVDEEGKTFYAEFSDYDESQCDEWIHNNVIKHLKWAKDGPIEDFANIYADCWEAYGTKEYIKEVLKDWLSRYDEVELVSDCCHYDMVLFIDIFGTAFDIPNNVNPTCYDINQDIASHYRISQKEAFNISREEIIEKYNKTFDDITLPDDWKIKITGDKHNSLYDAKVIKGIYKIINLFYIKK